MKFLLLLYVPVRWLSDIGHRALVYRSALVVGPLLVAGGVITDGTLSQVLYVLGVLTGVGGNALATKHTARPKTRGQAGRASLLVAAVVVGTLGLVCLTSTQSHAGIVRPHDPAMMNHDEWSAINEGQTKARVESDCACTGTWNGMTGTHNGNDYRQRYFLTPVGEAFVWFRFGSDNAYHVGWYTSWCPGDTYGVEVGNLCTQTHSFG